MKYVFECRKNGELVDWHEVEAASESQAWERYGMAMADYPPAVAVACYREDLCPACRGTGLVACQDCPACQGRGYRLTKEEIPSAPAGPQE